MPRAPEEASPQDPARLLHTPGYRRLLVFAAVLGAPVAAGAYFFLSLLTEVRQWVYDDLPDALGYGTTPTWWPIAPLLLAGVIVGLISRYVPGRGGATPAEGLHAGGTPGGVEILGIAVASTASVGLGPVVGPEGPLMALGSGVAILILRTVTRRDPPEQAGRLIGLTGSFAAISTLLGSPIIGAVFLLEASGLGGTTAAVALVPGLLASGIGALIFTGLGSLTGLTPLSLAAGPLTSPGTPTVSGICWAVVIGILAPLLCKALRDPARALARPVNANPVLWTPVIGLVVAALAIAYAEITDHSVTDVLFSGQEALPDLLKNGATLPAWILLALVLAKSAGYLVSLAAFRGGPIFPAVFLGAALGLLLSHLPGLPPITGAAVGVAAMGTGMLRLPISSLLLGAVLFGQAGLDTLPLTIIATVVSYVVIMLVDPPVPAAHGAPEPAGRS